ncbi:MAG: diguanylate cyclase [Sulfurimonas sp. RIFOXYD12_FULL_33_39]|uniref:diguanylate cyclase n=1 Tax=unclassified Sulfurimonas TaxID=2623549 RepID=UPI0008ABD1E1|nr:MULTISPECIES: diguanylate cyclase [unclassified Sulfurimonas]OHE03142.1 MAG: diguanylate cyclase [Sulfurimonas sp. RIFCSPLOWO2_12_FULL_34_6]OHE10559.1 MAG: diguanylate cyclase [Sulfurimonas sp. RIFOXYD12_FULL_33_39]OHE15018.1 MAG: diguanylate cyclase [Sulfurimonas sp. RIFOXYD2_FULL_34_21]
MKFPSISEIATTEVVSTDINQSIANAMKIMFSHEHRNIIVLDGDVFRILTVNDILNIKAKNIDLNISLKDLKLTAVPIVKKDKSVLHTLEYLSYNIEYICAVNDDGSLYGLITHTDVISSVDPDTLMDNFYLNDFLKLGKRAKWINKDVKTQDLFCDLLHNTSDSVIVVENFKPIGIFTTKDVIRVMKQDDDLSLAVSNYMSSPVDTITKNASVKEALEFLKNKHYKRVVVVDEEGNISGIISQKELISLTYSKWVILMKEYQEELDKINTSLLHKNKKYEQLASKDSLSGLYNRTKFLELYEASYEIMRQRENEMSLIIMDIDNFKIINDTYGHNIGDKVIIQISQALLNVLRSIDIVCRWGGEEFVILLPAVNFDNALAIAQKLRVYIQELEIENIGRITASFGVSKVKKDGDINAVIDRADKALYLAKASGRNCVKAETDL